MEGNGDIVAELNIFYPEVFPLKRLTYKPDNYKMCKDDIGKLFYNVSGVVRKDMIMTNEYNIQSKGDDFFKKLSRADSDFIDNDDHMLSIIQKKSEDAMNKCLLPVWKNTSDLCGFSRNSKSLLNKFENSFINGSKASNATKESLNTECYSTSKSLIISDSSLDTTESILRIYEESNSSSIEEIFCPKPNDPNEFQRKYIEKHGFSNIIEKEKLKSISLDTSTPKNSPIKKASPSVVVKVEKSKDEKGQKKDWKMPELIPTLVCLDDDDSTHSEVKSNEVINVAESPEMPKLVPFSAEAEELLLIKKEHLADEPTEPNSNAHLQNIQELIFLHNTNRTQCNAVNLQTCSRKLFQDNGNLNTNLKLNNKLDSSPKISSKGLESEIPSAVALQMIPKRQTEVECLDDKFESKISSLEASDSENTESETETSVKEISSTVNQKFKTTDSNKLLSVSYKCEGEDSQTSLNNRQPQVVLRRLSSDHLSLHNTDKNTHLPGCTRNSCKTTFEHCLSSFQDSGDNHSLASNPEKVNSSTETPEIDSIEGVQFYQFPTKHAMDEFTQKAMDGKLDEEVIILTKTNDITLIKGWREKRFPQYINNDESSQNAVPGNAHFNSEDGKALNFHNCVNDGTEEQADKNDDKNCNEDFKPEQLKKEDEEPKKESDLESKPVNESDLESKPVNESDLESKPVNESDLESKAVNKYDLESKPMNKSEPDLKPDTRPQNNSLSAFVSKELEDFLKNSSKLNVSLLQKVNPNITPISPEASILSLGKLRKGDDNHLNTLQSLKKRNYLLKRQKEEIKQDEEEIIFVNDVQPSAVVTLSSSEDSSSDENIPVSKLSRGRKRTKLGRPVAARVTKRKKSDSSESSQRVVLRLTKQSRGAAKSYKVSEITCEKESSERSSSLSSSSTSSESEEELPDCFKVSANGTVPTIKETVFLKETEPKLLEEFLNNLNMCGMSKDVAMLVQSNQSYFDKGPDLTSEDCTEALEALLTNQEFIDIKNKPTPKKKLKAWQKYLPKNLPRVQQQAIKFAAKNIPSPAAVPSVNSTVDTGEKKLKGKYKLKHLKSKMASKIQPLGATLNLKRKSISEGVDIIKKVKKIRKRTRSEIEMPDDISAIERGKRSIRLPARYLDSAVLAAGSEWVSPIFVDEKNARKKLLDVLDKMTPSKDVTDTPKNELSSENSVFLPVKKKNTEVQNKAVKGLTKGPTIPKKILEVSQETKKESPEKAKTANNRKMEVSSFSNPTSESRVYNLPLCSCTPCSRTACFNELTKEFVCMHNHNQPHPQIINSTLYNKLEKDFEIVNMKITENNKIKLNSDSSIKLAKLAEPISENQTLFNCAPNSANLKISDKNCSSEVKQPVFRNINSLPSLTQANSLGCSDKSKISSTEVTKTGLVNITSQSSGNFYVIVNNAGQNISIVPCTKPLQKPTVSDLRNKPSILLRKAATEAQAPLILPTPSINSQPPMVLKLPDKPLMPKGGSIQTSQVLPLNVQSNTSQLTMVPPGSTNTSNLQTIMVNDKMYVCTSVLKDSTTIASPVSSSPSLISNVASQIMPISSKTSTVINQRPLPKILLETSKNHQQKPLSDRRRKSPLSQRRFSDDDSDVDVDTVDDDFDALAIMRGPILDSDASDNECAEVFATNLLNIVNSTSTKTITERNRRLQMKKMFERLKPTCPLFKSARNCKEILEMSIYAIEKYKREDKALRCAKKILRLHNTQLLRKLIVKMRAIEDPNARDLLKLQIIHRLSTDFKNTRLEKSKLLQRIALSTKQGEKKDLVVSDMTKSSSPTSTIGATNKEIVQMDFEGKETALTCINPEPLIQDQPVVQLRILESSSTAEKMEKNSDAKEPTDANNSDDDLLIIDLSDDTPTKTARQLSPEKATQNISSEINQCNQSKTEVTHIKKFPGLLPLFGPPIYDNIEPPMSGKPEAVKVDNNCHLEANLGPVNISAEIQSPNKIQSPLDQFFMAPNKLLDLSELHKQSVGVDHVMMLPKTQNADRVQPTNLTVSPSTPLNLSITGGPQQTAKFIPEEIVIDDSDEESDIMVATQSTKTLATFCLSDKPSGEFEKQL